jgi:hypothetical protein
MKPQQQSNLPSLISGAGSAAPHKSKSSKKNPPGVMFQPFGNKVESIFGRTTPVRAHFLFYFFNDKCAEIFFS